MPDWVRVKDKGTGHRLTVMASELKSNPDAYQELKQDAVDHHGDPLPPEFSTSSTSEGQTATSKKES